MKDHEFRLHQNRPRASQIGAGAAPERAKAVTPPAPDDGRATIRQNKLHLADLLGDQEDSSGIRIKLEETVVGDFPIPPASIFKKLFHHLLHA